MERGRAIVDDYDRIKSSISLSITKSWAKTIPMGLTTSASKHLLRAVPVGFGTGITIILGIRSIIDVIVDKIKELQKTDKPTPCTVYP